MKNLANKSLPPSAVFQLEMVGFGTFFFFLNIWMGSYITYIYTYLNQNVSHNILNALGGFGSYKVFSYEFSPTSKSTCGLFKLYSF